MWERDGKCAERKALAWQGLTHQTTWAKSRTLYTNSTKSTIETCTTLSLLCTRQTRLLSHTLFSLSLCLSFTICMYKPQSLSHRETLETHRSRECSFHFLILLSLFCFWRLLQRVDRAPHIAAAPLNWNLVEASWLVEEEEVGWPPVVYIIKRFLEEI